MGKLRMIWLICEEQNWKCSYCRRSLTKQQRQSNTATKDHVQPLSKGGANTRANIVAACYRCNQLKANLTLEEFRAKYPTLDSAPEISSGWGVMAPEDYSKKLAERIVKAERRKAIRTLKAIRADWFAWYDGVMLDYFRKCERNGESVNPAFRSSDERHG